MQVVEPKQRITRARRRQPARSPHTDPALASTRRRRLLDHVHAHRVRIALLALGIFVLDSVTDVDIVVPVLYVNVVLLAMRSGRKSDVAVAGWASVGLTIVSFGLTVKPGVSATVALLNTALSLLAILCVTLLCLKFVESQEETLRTRDRLSSVSRGFFLRTLLASVAREVTKPIAAIGADAEVACRALSAAPPDLAQTELATRRIVQDVERISAVVGRLRKSMAPRDVASVVCDVQELIERAVERLRFVLVDAGIEITLACAPDLKIVADETLIDQALVDALASTIEVSRTIEAGTRRISLETEALPGEVRISIADDGVGPEAATFDRIFDPFTVTGAGVGLAVCQSIIEVHDGTIRARPRAPSGLIIEIMLPAAGARLA